MLKAGIGMAMVSWGCCALVIWLFSSPSTDMVDAVFVKCFPPKDSIFLILEGLLIFPIDQMNWK